MKTIVKQCINCDKDFNALLSEIQRGNGKFCSLTCSASYNGRKYSANLPLNTECSLCGKLFYRGKSKKSNSKSGLFFCCREHKDIAQRLESGFTEIHPPAYGTGKYNHTYRAVAFRNHPNVCNRCGYSKYVEVLMIHHKDRNRENNTPDNLEILCPTCHEVEHFLSKDGRWK